MLNASGGLPAGVFSNVQVGGGPAYWSASIDPATASNGLTLLFDNVNVDAGAQKDQFVGLFVWCVRGGNAGPEYGSGSF
jgi:hypothetical protein